MSTHLREQWARLAHRGGVHFIILPNDPGEAHAALREHYETHVAPREGATWIRDPWTREAMHELTSKHGFSIHDYPGISPHKGYMVSTMPEAEEAHPMSELAHKPDLVRAYHDAHAEPLKDKRNLMGAWEDHGRAYFDISQHTDDEETARKLAQDHNQDAYYDLNKKKSVYVRASRAAASLRRQAVEDKDGNPIEDLNGTPIHQNPDGTIPLYHATSEQNAHAIMKSRRFHSHAEPGSGDVFFSNFPRGGEGFGDHVVKVHLHPSQVRLNDAFRNGEVHVAAPRHTIRPEQIIEMKKMEQPA